MKRDCLEQARHRNSRMTAMRWVGHALDLKHSSLNKQHFSAAWLRQFPWPLQPFDGELRKQTQQLPNLPRTIN